MSTYHSHDKASKANLLANFLGPAPLQRFANRPLLMTRDSAKGLQVALQSPHILKGLSDFGAEMQASTADLMFERRAGSTFHMDRGIAIIPAEGTLVHRLGTLDPYWGWTGYDGIMRKLRDAGNDQQVRGIILDEYTGGGDVDGVADCAEMIRQIRKIKPVWAISNTAAFSAGYYLASQADRVILAQGAGVGSVGVVMMHVDFSKALDDFGYKVTLIFAGAHKVDGNPYEALPEDVRNTFKAECEAVRLTFAQAVADGRGMNIADVLATEAQCFMAQDAIDVGFADAVLPSQNIVQAFLDDLGGTLKLPRVTKAKATAAAPPTHISKEIEDMNTPNGAAAPQSPAANAEAQQPQQSAVDPAKIAADATTAAMKRAGDILALPEAKGREASANHLAFKTSLSVDDAKAMLATMPAGAAHAAESRDALGMAMQNVKTPAVAAISPSGAAKSAAVINFTDVYASRAEQARKA